jgi:hypothetical protein
LVEISDAPGEVAQQVASERRRLLEDAFEAAGVDHVHLHRRVGDDRRRSGPVVEQPHLADDLACADPPDDLLADLHARVAVVDDEGGRGHLALPAQHLPGLEDRLVGDARQASQLLGRAVLEQRHLTQPPDLRVVHVPHTHASLMDSFLPAACAIRGEPPMIVITQER